MTCLSGTIRSNRIPSSKFLFVRKKRVYKRIAHGKYGEQLGMSTSKADGRLRKLILYDLVKKVELNVCYRCNLPILSAEDLSIDHKKEWRNVDPILYWDLNNIAFSHKKCNKPSRYVASGKWMRKTCEDGKTWCSRCAEKSFGDVGERLNPLLWKSS